MNSNPRHHLPESAESRRATSSDNKLIPYPGNIYPEELLSGSSSLDLNDFITVLKRRKKLILWTALGTLLLALIVTLLMQPVYRADSTIKVERYAANPNVDILNAETSRSDRDFFETQIQLIQTKTLAKRVIDALGLDTRAPAEGLLTKIKKLVSLDTKKDSKDSIEELFLKNLTVKPISNSQLLKISYDSADPQLAAKISNEVANTFVKQNLERRFDTATSYKSYVSQNIETIRKSLQDAETRLNDFARKNNIVQDNEGEITTSHTLKKQQEELVQAEKERIEAEAAYELFKKDPEGNPASVINNPYILSLKKSVARLESKYQAMRNKRTRAARNLKKEIDGLHDQINTESEAIKLSLKNRLLEAQHKENMLKTQLNKLRQSALDEQSKVTQFKRLKREVEINQLAYNKQLEQMMDVNVASNIGTNNISIIDKATPPTKKYKPSLKTNLVLGLLLGLLLGIGLAFLREFSDDSIKDSDSLEKITGLPVLSQLPEINDLGPKKIALLTAIEPRSPLAESIKSLRTSLRFSTRNGAPKSILITSSGPAEGKTTVALNLATAYAQSGSRVLLIDADLRNPSTHQLLELDNLKGLTNYLANALDNSKEIIQSSMIKNLDVITSGPIPPDPVELLSGNKMEELLEISAHDYDHIIIDGPPVLGLADALVLAHLTEATIITAQAGKSRKTSILDTLKRLERAHATIIGSILTRVSRAVNPEYDEQYYTYTKPVKPATLARIK